MFGLIFGAIGAVASIIGSLTQAQAAAKQAKASKDAEKLRLTQVNLESARQRRESYRNLLRARSAALVAANSQGAQSGSGLQGAYGQQANKTADNVTGVNQGQEISRGIFEANASIADAQSMAAWGAGLSSLGQIIGGLKIG